MKKLIFLLIPFSAALQAATPFQSSFYAGISIDDNVTRAERGSDIESDSILQIGANTSTRWSLDDSSFISLNGTLDLSQYADFSKLSSTSIGAEMGYHFRPAAGYTAFRYMATIGHEFRLYESDQREGSATTIRLSMARRLTDETSMHLGISLQTIDADSVVFDADNNRIYADFEFRQIENHSFYTTLSYTDGDVVSTTVPTQQIIDASAAIERDDAFTDLTPQRFAYKLSANTIALKLGDSYAIDSLRSVEASVLYYSSDAGAYNDYSGLVYAFRYHQRF